MKTLQVRWKEALLPPSKRTCPPGSPSTTLIARCAHLGSRAHHSRHRGAHRGQEVQVLGSPQQAFHDGRAGLIKGCDAAGQVGQQVLDGDGQPLKDIRLQVCMG